MNVGNYRVRYRDVYSAGVVLNSRFLDICDEAFTEYFRALGLPPEALYAVPFNGALGHMAATYRSTATIDDVLDLDVRCDHVGNTSLVPTYSITRDDATVFTGTARYINVDDSGQPIPVPAAVRSAVQTR